MAEVVDLEESNGGPLVATAIIFMALSWVSVLLRCYVRVHLTKNFQLDDAFMLISQVCPPYMNSTSQGDKLTICDEKIIFTFSCASIFLGVESGIGHHNASLPQDEEIEGLKWQALATASYVVDMMFIKLSIGVFLLRLSVERVYKYILWISLVIITVWSTVIFFWNIFQCNPVEKQWDYTIEDGRCVTPEQVVSAAYSISAMTILSDWLYVSCGYTVKGFG